MEGKQVRDAWQVRRQSVALWNPGLRRCRQVSHEVSCEVADEVPLEVVCFFQVGGHHAEGEHHEGQFVNAPEGACACCACQSISGAAKVNVVHAREQGQGDNTGAATLDSCADFEEEPVVENLAHSSNPEEEPSDAAHESQGPGGGY